MKKESFPDAGSKEKLTSGSMEARQQGAKLKEMLRGKKPIPFIEFSGVAKKQLRDVVEIYGVSPHCGVIFKGKNNLTNHDLFSVYQQTLIENGILSLGVNNFCLSHSEEDVNKFIRAVDLAFDKVKEAIEKNSVEEILKGEKFRPIFKR